MPTYYSSSFDGYFGSIELFVYVFDGYSGWDSDHMTLYLNSHLGIDNLEVITNENIGDTLNFNFDIIN